jgi:hypothetical protein
VTRLDWKKKNKDDGAELCEICSQETVCWVLTSGECRRSCSVNLQRGCKATGLDWKKNKDDKAVPCKIGSPGTVCWVLMCGDCRRSCGVTLKNIQRECEVAGLDWVLLSGDCRRSCSVTLKS